MPIPSEGNNRGQTRNAIEKGGTTNDDGFSDDPYAWNARPRGQRVSRCLFELIDESSLLSGRLWYGSLELFPDVQTLTVCRPRLSSAR